MVVSSRSAPASLAAKPLRLKAARLEREGDLAGAFEAYEQAVALAPQDPELLSSLAQLASRLEMHDQAVLLWSHLMARDPSGCAPALGCARALIAAARLTEAIEILKSTLQLHPQEPRLWASLGLALTYAGRAADALPFYDEAIRLDPKLPGSRYNRGLAWCDLSRPGDAEADFQAALKLSRQPDERATIEFSLATLELGRGALASGWDRYEGRLSPDWPKSVVFQAPGRRLTDQDVLAGRGLLVLAEQGLGDEVMFANTLPDLVEALGPDGRLVLAVEPRLVELFRRSFPTAEVCAHATERAGGRLRRHVAGTIDGRIDYWTPLASLARRFRRSPEAFPRTAYLRPDPARVQHWRDWLGGDLPAVGLTWRSGKIAGDRQRLYPALPHWVDLLRTPGVQFVNLQYGDCAEDLAALSDLSGVALREPPDLNIKDDIDELAALCAALDAVVSVQNATGALAGACGAEVAFIAGPGSWAQLGCEQMPWYAAGRLFPAADLGAWPTAIDGAARHLRDRFQA